MQLLEVISEVSEQISETKEDEEIDETTSESPEPSQGLTEKYQLEAYFTEIVNTNWQSEYMKALTIGLTIDATFPIMIRNANCNTQILELCTSAWMETIITTHPPTIEVNTLTFSKSLFWK